MYLLRAKLVSAVVMGPEVPTVAVSPATVAADVEAVVWSRGVVPRPAPVGGVVE